MRTLFIVLFLVHGCIHLLGYIKAFYPSFDSGPIQSVSRPFGLGWLLVGLLFIVTAILLVLKKEWWPILGIITILLSQILIIIFWKDARYGTILNLVFLLVTISCHADYKFNQMTLNESHAIFRPVNLSTSVVPTIENLGNLPTIVQKWLTVSGVFHTEKTVLVRLRQKGEMKTSPSGRWMPFTAQQYFNCKDPAFVWVTKVNPLPLLYMNGRDKLTDAQGEMLIKLFGIFPVVNEGKNEKINAASMQRYLAEMCWFPSAALNKYLIWESIDETSAKAILTLDNESVSGVFTFTSEGEFHSFETKRYYGSGKDAELEIWHIEALEQKLFDGIKIPSKCKVTWRLEEGDFNWLNLEITALEYNKPYPYE